MSSRGRKQEKHNMGYNKNVRAVQTGIVNIPAEARWKYVKKARQWCKTFFVEGVQKQEWFKSKEE